MADSTRRRYSGSPPYEAPSRSRSRSRSRSWSRPRGRPVSRSRSRSRGRDEAINPGNTLHVTGLSTRVTQEQLEEHFSKEGKVSNCFLVVEPRSRISRGFAFITMETLEDANRCIKHLNQSVLEHRQITVERSRRKRPRTPTPGHYLGLKNTRDTGYRGDRGRPRGGSSRDDYGYRRPARRSPPYRGGRDYSPRRSPPPYRGGRDYSPRRSPPPYRGGRDYSPRRSPPDYGGRSRRERSPPPYSPYRSPERNYGRR
ncbi:serine/arginine-rich splicing factor SR45a-like [Cynara cardunculus var. scolymus]|uniref:serine/arginine-rich splicing factor SR45a-like n=1 Tax=Cynara cardunculus var. scolymus TaxID=59895 RepID=UPI000D62363B|nr:serine/arginine-rich splicing factor SR45a-like [Cynara cardunculus var. scolymus]